MALTNIEKQELLNEIYTSLEDNSQSIEELTEARSLADTDAIELSGGKKVYYRTLKTLLTLQLETDVATLQQDFEALVGNNASEAIDNFNEILAFLDGVKDSETLAGKLEELRTGVNGASNARVVKSVGVEGDAEGVKLNVMKGSLTGEIDQVGAQDLPVAAAPFNPGSDSMAAPQPGRAGIITAQDYGRFDSAADYTEQRKGFLDGRKVVEDSSFEADAEKVVLVEHRWNADGTNTAISPLAVANPDDVPVVSYPEGEGGERRTALPVASTQRAGVVTAEQVGLIVSAPELAFRELWKAAGCTVNADAVPSEQYVCNNLPLSYEEAKAVYNAGSLDHLPDGNQYRGRKIRTNLPVFTGSTYSRRYDLYCAFHNSDIEVAAVGFDGKMYNPENWEQTFEFCERLHTVIGKVNRPSKNTFHKCGKLENVTFALDAQCGSFSLAYCPLISLASMQTIPANSASRTASISITVHADVYAKLTDPEGHPEWVQVVVDAAAKNIIFTTA